MVRDRRSASPLVSKEAYDTDHLDLALLRRDEDLLARAVQVSPIGIVVTTLDEGRILDVNERFLALTGYSREEVIGVSTLDLGIWVDPALRQVMVDAVHQGDSLRDFEVAIRIKSGETRLMAASFDAVDVDGLACALVQVVDITSRRRAEAARHVAEAQFQALVEQVPVVIYTEDLGDDDTYTYISPQIEALLGYAADEIVGHPGFFASKIHPEDSDEVQAEGERTTATGDPFRMEYRVQARDGRWVHLRDEAVLVWGEEDNPLHWQGVLVDVTERHTAEAALRESEQRNRAFIEGAIDCVVAMDQHGHFTEFNPAAERTFGYARDAVIGRELAELIVPPELQAAHRQGLRRYLDTGEGAMLEKRVEIIAMRADGSLFPVELAITPVLGEAGPWFVAYLHDISERIAMETALRASEERFRGLVQNSYDVITVVDRDGTRRYVSPSMERLLGYPATALVGGDAADLVHPDDVPVLRQAVARCLDGASQSPPFDIRVRHRDGRWRHFETIATNLLDDPAIEGIVFNSRCITARKEVEAALRESEERFRAAFDHAPIGLALVSHEGRFIQVNRSLCELTGYTEAALLAMTFQEMTHSDDLADSLAQAARMWAGEIDGYHLEKRYLHRDGRVIWVELTASVIHDAAGPPYALAQIQDISDRRRLELERATMLASEREYTRQLRDLTVMRADLTAIVAHELRSPIAALRIMASMLATGELSPNEEAETFRAVQAQITQLDRLVTDVASSAAAERDDFPVEFDAVSLAALLTDAEAFARTRFVEHPFTITEAPPVLVWCDPERVSQVLRNLLDNCAKHTPPGTRIELRAARDGGQVRFEVADDGPGIPPPELALIFEKFGRCRRSVDHQTPGAGLGLYLSHRIIAALGGELTVSSEPGRGTVFRFELMAVS